MSEIELLQQAKAAIKKGNKSRARRLLGQVVEQNPNSETAWLWLSAIIDDQDTERDCLEKVLSINPNNDLAKKYLLKLTSLPVKSKDTQLLDSWHKISSFLSNIISAKNKVYIFATIGIVVLLFMACVCFSLLDLDDRTDQKAKATATWPATWTTTPKYYATATPVQIYVTLPARTHPAGATAICKDGAYSFSSSRRGTCSHHGGVSVWLSSP